jgi:hypothetical protein
MSILEDMSDFSNWSKQDTKEVTIIYLVGTVIALAICHFVLGVI